MRKQDRPHQRPGRADAQKAIEWAKRCPNPTGEESVLEIRPVMEADDFGDEFTPELREQEERFRAKTAERP